MSSTFPNHLPPTIKTRTPAIPRTVQTSKFGLVPPQLAANLLPLPPNALPLHPVLVPHPTPSARPTFPVDVPRVSSRNAILIAYLDILDFTRFVRKLMLFFA